MVRYNGMFKAKTVYEVWIGFTSLEFLAKGILFFFLMCKGSLTCPPLSCSNLYCQSPCEWACYSQEREVRRGGKEARLSVWSLRMLWICVLIWLHVIRIGVQNACSELCPIDCLVRCRQRVYAAWQVGDPSCGLRCQLVWLVHGQNDNINFR